MMPPLKLLRKMCSLKHMAVRRGPDQTEGSVRWASQQASPKSYQAIQAEEKPFLGCCSWSFLAEAAGERAGGVWLCHSYPGSAEASFTQDLRELGTWGRGFSREQ